MYFYSRTHLIHASPLAVTRNAQIARNLVHSVIRFIFSRFILTKQDVRSEANELLFLFSSRWMLDCGTTTTVAIVAFTYIIPSNEIHSAMYS